MQAAVRARDRSGRDRPVAVAGSIADEVRGACRRQAAVLAEAGADLLVTEMIQSAEWHRPAVEAALDSGLPVWLGVSAARTEHGGLVTVDFADIDFADVVRGLAAQPVAAIAVMHTDIDTVDSALDVVQDLGGCCGIRPDHLRRLRADLGR